MPELHIDNLSFTYLSSSSAVLHSIHLTIHEGEFVLLAGPSGCGKSTLALALAGLIPARIAGRLRGGVYLGERNISQMDIHEVSQKIGMVFQNPDEQLIHLDVESEVAFGPENLALPRAEIGRRLAESLAYTGMERLRHQEIFALSGGQKQRVAISATLAMRPQVLVLDEPTSDLDPLGTQEVLRVLHKLNKQYGMTIVLVEHKIDEIVPWVDRILLMDEGRIVVDAAPYKAFDDIQLWSSRGVSVPQMVLLSRALPDIFQGSTPLSVEEAYNALHGTRYEQWLRQRNKFACKSDSPEVHPFTAVTTPAQSALCWDMVNLAYGNKQVLKNINLQVLPQEWVAIVGPNGSGKTSLASLAMGFQPPTAGVIRYKNKVVQAGNISRQSESMAYLFQAADTMLFGATVEQEFLFGAKHRRNRQGDLPFTVNEVMQTVDLADRGKDNPFQLSHGQRKRLAIGVLLTRYPELLILDEPTTGQDQGHARTFLRFLQQLREDGKLTYIMITHNMEAVAHYASRMVVLHDGEVFLNGAPAYIFARMEELAQCSILPPAIAQLHVRLCEGQAVRVDLSVESFLKSLQPIEVTS